MSRTKPLSKAEINERALWIAADMLVTAGYSTVEVEPGEPGKVRRWIKSKARKELLRERREGEAEGMKIEELGLSDRVRNALRRNGIETVEQLMELTPGEVYTLRGIGKVGFDDILHCLERQKKKTP